MSPRRHGGWEKTSSQNLRGLEGHWWTTLYFRPLQLEILSCRRTVTPLSFMPMRKPPGWWTVLLLVLSVGLAKVDSTAQNTSSGTPAANGTRNNEFKVLDFGARADGQTLNTAAISAAVLAAVKVGGGTITFPPGRYRTGTFRLVSNITLQLQAGAV